MGSKLTQEIQEFNCKELEKKINRMIKLCYLGGPSEGGGGLRERDKPCSWSEVKELQAVQKGSQAYRAVRDRGGRFQRMRD